MVYKTLNNASARRIIRHALEHDYRACAYSLYNLHDVFYVETYNRLFNVVVELLGHFYNRIFCDPTIGFEVRYFISLYFSKLTLEHYEKIKN